MSSAGLVGESFGIIYQDVTSGYVANRTTTPYRKVVQLYQDCAVVRVYVEGVLKAKIDRIEPHNILVQDGSKVCAYSTFDEAQRDEIIRKIALVIRDKPFYKIVLASGKLQLLSWR